MPAGCATWYRRPSLARSMMPITVRPTAISMRGTPWAQLGHDAAHAQRQEGVVGGDEVEHRAIHVVGEPEAGVMHLLSGQASPHMFAPKPAPSSDRNMINGLRRATPSRKSAAPPARISQVARPR